MGFLRLPLSFLAFSTQSEEFSTEALKFGRFVWNFFRLENEHLNNCGKFRAVRDISVAPINSSDQEKILRMMDEDDGVVNRRKRKILPAKKPKEDKQRLLLSVQQGEGGSLRALSE
uniref:Xenotropic and polytropic retrovirus receptor 1 homolog n=1 Tax=Cacopsylla melanoneura TaxID=428564 RepID=A0A8D9FF10_9HEMI